MTPSPALLLAEIKKNNLHFYKAAFFVPEAQAVPYLALLGLWGELARIQAVVSQLTTGYMRLTFWRDAIGNAALGQVAEQPLLQAMAPSLKQQPKLVEALLLLLDAHEAEIEASPALNTEAAEKTSTDAQLKIAAQKIATGRAASFVALFPQYASLQGEFEKAFLAYAHGQHHSLAHWPADAMLRPLKAILAQAALPWHARSFLLGWFKLFWAVYK